MSVSTNFETFYNNLAVKNQSVISDRYKAITRRLNADFWDINSETRNSFYGGSYGRDTAIGGDSDVDMIFELPWAVYTRYNAHLFNGQSSLLQAVRTSLKKTYHATDIGADGQVIVVPFSDNITFEIVPAFPKSDGTYTYADTNDGGRWRITNPKAEIRAISERNEKCNFNLKPLCKMARSWKRKWSVPIGGLLIDTLAYQFIQNWEYRDKSSLYYDWMTRDFFAYLSSQDTSKQYWLAPGSSQYVWRKGAFEFKAKQCYNLALQAIEYETKGHIWSAGSKWSEIYGNAYPS